MFADVLENGALSIEKIKEETAMVYGLERLPVPKNKFSQTFFKYLRNSSDNRCIEILNSNVDHGDKSLVFYRTSAQLLNELYMNDV